MAKSSMARHWCHGFFFIRAHNFCSIIHFTALVHSCGDDLLFEGTCARVYEVCFHFLFAPNIINQQYKVIPKQDNHFQTDCIGNRARVAREETENKQKNTKFL